MSGRKGGNGGSERRFDLADDESIIRIEGRGGVRIDQLKFITNKSIALPSISLHNSLYI